MNALRNVVTVIPAGWDIARQKHKLIVKFGVDPTAPDLHLGHFVVLRTLRELQAFDHQVVLVVGDATARIGDPSGRNKTRPILKKQAIEANLKTYLGQVKPLLNWKKVRVVRNSEWFDTLGFVDLIALAQHVTVSQTVERNDFSKRLQKHTEIGLHELYYPLMQAYDSYKINADVEVGGTDQLFNMLLGRELGRKLGGKEQVVVATELLVGTDGVKKMSKSLGNDIGIREVPQVMLVKLMQIPDEAITTYAKLLTDMELPPIERMLHGGANPRDVKLMVAQTITASLHGPVAAAKAVEYFERTVSQKALPAVIPGRSLRGTYKLLGLILKLGLAPSRNAARRLIAQGGIQIDGRVLTDPEQAIAVKNGMVVRKGKKTYLRLKS